MGKFINMTCGKLSSMSQEIQQLLDLTEEREEFGILIAINTLGSLNLKNITDILDQPKSSASRRLKNLLSKDLITLDAEKTVQTRGKYYKLSDSVKNVIHAQANPSTKQKASKIAPYSPKWVEKTAVGLEFLAMFNLYLNKINNHFFLEHKHDQTLLQSDDIIVSSTFLNLHIESQEEMDELKKILTNFTNQLQKFKKQPGESPDLPSSKMHAIYYSILPLGKVIPAVED